MNEKSKFHQQLHHKHELEHLYNIYVEIKHYNSLSPITLEWKIQNFTKKYTDCKTINSNNCAKFEVNWPRGSQFTERNTKNLLQFDEWSPITLEWKIEISPKSIQTIRLSIPITMRSLKWIGQGVLNLQRDIRKIAYNLMNKVP